MWEMSYTFPQWARNNDKDQTYERFRTNTGLLLLFRNMENVKCGSYPCA